MRLKAELVKDHGTFSISHKTTKKFNVVFIRRYKFNVAKTLCRTGAKCRCMQDRSLVKGSTSCAIQLHEMNESDRKTSTSCIEGRSDQSNWQRVKVNDIASTIGHVLQGKRSDAPVIFRHEIIIHRFMYLS